MAQRPVHWTKFTGTDWYHTVEKRIDWLQNKVLAGERENNVLREQNAYLKDLVEQYSSTIRPCMQTENKWHACPRSYTTHKERDRQRESETQSESIRSHSKSQGMP